MKDQKSKHYLSIYIQELWIFSRFLKSYLNDKSLNEKPDVEYKNP